jgi:hypothetical protein
MLGNAAPPASPLPTSRGEYSLSDINTFLLYGFSLAESTFKFGRFWPKIAVACPAGSVYLALGRPQPRFYTDLKKRSMVVDFISFRMVKFLRFYAVLFTFCDTAHTHDPGSEQLTKGLQTLNEC